MAGHKKKNAKNRNRILMRDLKAKAALDPDRPTFTNVRPEEALQEALDRAFSWMNYYAKEASKLPRTQLWRETINGRVAHEVLRAEAEARQEVAYLAARSLDLGLAERQLQLNEQTATIMISFIELVVGRLNLTPSQRRALGPTIRESLADFEGTARELTQPRLESVS